MNLPIARMSYHSATLRWSATILISLVMLIGATVHSTAASNADQSSEYAVKAAYLFKFGAFVEWPAGAFENAKAPLVIGIVGVDPFGIALDNIIKDHTIDGRPVVVLRSERIEQLNGEHILFISQSEKNNMGLIAANLLGKSVLTVAEFEDPNIVIRFVVENDKVRFDINSDQAIRARIKLSSKLMSVARVVTGK